MTLIVEDGTGIISANSYGMITEADAYFTARANTAWTGDDTVKSAALIAACDYQERKFGDRIRGFKSNNVIRNAKASFLPTENPSEGDTLTIGSVTYTFTASPAVYTDIEIGDLLADTLEALVVAIGGTATGATAHPLAGATVALDGRLAVYALATGLDGNSIATGQTGDWGSWNFATLTGGNYLGMPQGLSFPRDDLYLMDGTQVVGIPHDVKVCQFEYAVRALTATLAPDPTQDASGRIVIEETKKIGPIEKSVKFAEGAVLENAFKSYPMADVLMGKYLGFGRRVTR